MLRPQDIVALVYLAIKSDNTFQQKDLAAALNLSPAEISMSLRRSSESGLYDPASKKVNVSNLMELLIHSVKYFFPARLKGMDRGIPTAWAVAPLARHFKSMETVPIWPHAHGTVSGLVIEPIADIVPAIALKEPKFHEAMALVDAFRIGKAREKELAKKELAKRLNCDAT